MIVGRRRWFLEDVRWKVGGVEEGRVWVGRGMKWLLFGGPPPIEDDFNVLRHLSLMLHWVLLFVSQRSYPRTEVSVNGML